MPAYKDFDGSSSAALRATYMRETAIPHARDVFAGDPEVQSLLVVVAQFWCDEAVDAVHVEHVISTDRDPVWPAVYVDNPFYLADPQMRDEETGLDVWEASARGTLALNGGRERFHWVVGYPILDSNTDAITAFAAYVEEAGTQDMPLAATGSLYAILRRGEGDAVDVDIVGEVHRPEWEDRFDVGFELDDEDRALDRMVGDWSGDGGGAVSPEDALAARRAAGAARPSSFLARLLRGLLRRR